MAVVFFFSLLGSWFVGPLWLRHRRHLAHISVLLEYFFFSFRHSGCRGSELNGCVRCTQFIHLLLYQWRWHRTPIGETMDEQASSEQRKNNNSETTKPAMEKKNYMKFFKHTTSSRVFLMSMRSAMWDTDKRHGEREKGSRRRTKTHGLYNDERRGGRYKYNSNRSVTNESFKLILCQAKDRSQVSLCAL